MRVDQAVGEQFGHVLPRRRSSFGHEALEGSKRVVGGAEGFMGLGVIDAKVNWWKGARKILARSDPLDEGAVDLDVQLGVHNPNGFSLSAEAVSGTLYVGSEQRVGRGEARPKQSIAGHSDGVVASRVHIDWADVTGLLPLLQQERTR